MAIEISRTAMVRDFAVSGKNDVSHRPQKNPGVPGSRCHRSFHIPNCGMTGRVNHANQHSDFSFDVPFLAIFGGVSGCLVELSLQNNFEVGVDCFPVVTWKSCLVIAFGTRSIYQIDQIHGHFVS